MITRSFRRLVEGVVHALFSLKNWTPTVDQGGAVAVTVTMAKYLRMGGLVYATAHLAVTGTGTANNTIAVAGLPVTGLSADIDEVVGKFVIRDAGVVYYEGVVTMWSTTQLAFQAHNVSGRVGVTPNWALGNGDNIDFSVWYRV